jgi:stage V sporulation protein B
LSERDAIISLRAVSFALPFIALSNALHGFFNGVKQIPKSAFTSLFEQFFRISATLLALQSFSGSSREVLCLVLVICNASSEAASCIILSVFYYFEKRKYPISSISSFSLKKRFIGITLPIAVSSLIRSALTTTEHILIPIGLRLNGLSGEKALAEYGIISGMVLPVLLYPMSLLSSFASITIAELSSRVSAGEGRATLQKTVAKGITFALIYGIGCTSIIGFFSERLGIAIYKSTEAGYFIRIMAPLIIFMYVDHIADGMLKGLDKQNYVMRVNIFDAALSVVFAALLIPRFGIYGFTASLYLCEIMNCSFSFGKLFLIMKPDIGIIKSLIIPCACAIISTHAIAYIGSEIPIISAIITSASVYLLLLGVCGSLDVFKDRHNKENTQNKASGRLKTGSLNRL